MTASDRKGAQYGNVDVPEYVADGEIVHLTPDAGNALLHFEAADETGDLAPGDVRVVRKIVWDQIDVSDVGRAGTSSVIFKLHAEVCRMRAGDCPQAAHARRPNPPGHAPRLEFNIIARDFVIVGRNRGRGFLLGHKHLGPGRRGKDAQHAQAHTQNCGSSCHDQPPSEKM